MSTPAKVKKWNRNLAIIIPKNFAKKHNLKAGSVIDLDPAQPRNPKPRRYKLSELMAKFKPQHRHGEWNLGPPTGNEIW